MGEDAFIPLNYSVIDDQASLKKSIDYFAFLNKRRSVRHFSDRPVAKEVIKNLILTASTAPSGANKQPWLFCAISNQEIKQKIRTLAEEEEKKSYKERMSKQWLNDLEPLGTGWEKPFITTAPWLIVVMKKPYEIAEDGSKKNNYYVNESVGIAVGLLISAIHNAGLVTLIHTPNPMNFIAKVLKRPENERPMVLLPVGYPEKNCLVPNLKRKCLKKIIVFYD